MKFWNKDKKIRTTTWTKVSRPKGIYDTDEMKAWCKNQPSDGKYFVYYASKNWWFEKHEDAVMFALRWL
jgi:hypothetical protein